MSKRLHEILGIDPTSPEYIAARKEIDERYARAVKYSCAFEACIWFFDPKEQRVMSGFGATGCPCDVPRSNHLRLHTKIEEKQWLCFWIPV